MKHLIFLAGVFCFWTWPCCPLKQDSSFSKCLHIHPQESDHRMGKSRNWTLFLDVDFILRSEELFCNLTVCPNVVTDTLWSNGFDDTFKQIWKTKTNLNQYSLGFILWIFSFSHCNDTEPFILKTFNSKYHYIRKLNDCLDYVRTHFFA